MSESASPPTLIEALRALARREPEGVGCWFQTRQGDWRSLSWLGLWDQAQQVAGGLLELGIESGDLVGILSHDRVEAWVADLGATLMGARLVHLSVEGLRPQHRAVVEQTQPRALFVEDPLLLGRVLEACDGLPGLDRLIYFDARAERPHASGGRTQIKLDEVVEWPPSERIVSFDEPVERGEVRLELDPDCVEALVALPVGSLVAYTAGTTGPPQAVTLSQAQFMGRAHALASALEITPADVNLQTLPLSHLFGRVIAVACLLSGGATMLPREALESWALSADVPMPTLALACPTTLERLRVSILSDARTERRVSRAVFDWAFRVSRNRHRPRPTTSSVRAWFDRAQAGLAQRWLQAALSGTVIRRLRALVSVGGPLAEDVCAFFRTLGVPLVEGYGVVEAGGLTHLEDSDAFLLGRVGVSLEGVKARLDPEGEVHLRCVDVEGAQGDWIATGDLGEIDGEGRLFLRGRKRAQITLEEGTVIHPELIEAQLKAHPLISQVLVYGHERPFLTGLIALDQRALERLALEVGIEAPSPEALTRDLRVYKVVEGIVDETHRALTPVEQLRKFAVLERPLSESLGELTPLLQIRRAFTVARYRALINSFYDAQF